MEDIKFDELKPNPKNPRTVSKHDFESIKKSITEFGDLSGIVFNGRTGQLVGGHLRTNAFKDLPGDKKVVITQRFAQPNKVGTVAVGYVTYAGEFYNYRLVDWSLDRETAANIAANRISGEFDLDLLAEMDQWLLDNNPDLLEYTGQSKSEIDHLLGNDNNEDPDSQDPDDNKITFKLDATQYETVEKALAIMKSKKSFASERNKELDGNALYYICSEWLDLTNLN